MSICFHRHTSTTLCHHLTSTLLPLLLGVTDPNVWGIHLNNELVGVEKSERHSYDSHVTTLIISMVMVHKMYIFKLQCVQNCRRLVENRWLPEMTSVSDAVYYVTLWFAIETDGGGDQGLEVRGWALEETKEPGGGLIVACLNISTV